MAKLRVYELAKELNIQSREILDALSTTKYAVKQAANGLEPEAVTLIRDRFTPNAEKKAAGNGAGETKPSNVQTVAVSGESSKAVTKKENVRPESGKEEDRKREEKKKEASRQTEAGKVSAKQEPRKTPASEGQKEPTKGKEPVKAKRPAGPKDAAGNKPRKTDGENRERPKKKASISAIYNAQYSRGGGSGKPKNGQGSRNNRGNRRDNPRPETHSIIKPRPVGERALRPISERTKGNTDDFSDIQQRMERNRQERSGDSRPQKAARSGRTEKVAAAAPERSIGKQEKERQSGKNIRGNEKSPLRAQETGGNNARGDKNSRKGKERFDKKGDKFSKEAATSSPDELRGKESRGNDRKNNNNNRRKDRDKQTRRQENYVNLEKHGGRKKPQQQPQQPKEDENVIKTITLPEKLTIRELADKMKLQPAMIVKKLFLKGQMVTVNQEVDFDTAEEIALEFNYICEPEEKIDVIAELLKEEDENEADMSPRPPVVCVMGHVDHGKTSLLDAIRSTRVTDREAGGITQHIGASVVSINDQTITFLDTPGHEAFTAMRMRGANSTDIAILVVAADDGVMPQTVEAINHAKAAGVEIIVAVNKIDKPSANIEKVKQELSEYELIPEDWGGSTIFCPVSAHTREGIDNLLEMILLTAEVLELKANPKRNARGLVIEAQLDKGRGSVATVLVQKGTLHVGDPIGCGSSYGKIRAMVDDKGRRVKEAGPSTPVEILGLNNVPNAGETFVCCESEKAAKAFADTFISEEKNKLIEDTKAKMSLDDLFSQIQSGNMKELDIIVKADVQGSVEAVKQSLVKLSNEEVVVKVIHGGVGAINESDVILASASNAIIIGFNVRPDPMAKSTAEREGVDIRLYKVIYNAIEDVEAAMKGLLDPIFEEKVIGHAEIRQIFKASGVGNIAGSYVLDGTVERGCRVRITREGEQIFEGDLASLKRFKDDVKEVRSGYECGLVFEGFSDIQELDIVEAYKMVEVPR